MPEGHPVLLERRNDGVALVTLDRPKMNALSSQVLDALGSVAQELTDDPPGAIVLWGGPRMFAAGADIAELSGLTELPPPDAARGAEGVARRFSATTGALADLPRPTIAAICGYALGGGLELALSCDFRIMADDAKVGLPEVSLGIIPGGGGTQRLPRLIGPSRAKDLIFSGRHVSADEASAIGLVDRVAPRDAVLTEALAWAGQLARGPAVALRLAKRAVDVGLDGPLREGLSLERESFVAVFGTEDARAGVATFVEQGPGKATFVGR